jgi:DNA polymerase III subunit epsilon
LRQAENDLQGDRHGDAGAAEVPRFGGVARCAVQRFDVDNSARTAHGARLDAELLAAVYMELLGGRQHGLGLAATAEVVENSPLLVAPARDSRARPPRFHEPTAEELAAHVAFVEKLKNPLWTA